ncbi:hypothetical protein NDU88_000366 [Pleurodeles waltl]|uniref:Uncharacterized protein n=1 Tax=Pleurodeles waltl TaxID=8319 RepID=A0AAV7Q3Z2_PLEWA|nr:hypothetical protein NDU88_000366 [Pleurodeles waltl]
MVSIERAPTGESRSGGVPRRAVNYEIRGIYRASRVAAEWLDTSGAAGRQASVVPSFYVRDYVIVEAVLAGPPGRMGASGIRMLRLVSPCPMCSDEGCSARAPGLWGGSAAVSLIALGRAQYIGICAGCIVPSSWLDEPFWPVQGAGPGVISDRSRPQLVYSSQGMSTTQCPRSSGPLYLH